MVASIALVAAVPLLMTCRSNSPWRHGQEGEPEHYLSLSPRQFRDYCEERVRPGINSAQAFAYDGSTDDRHFFLFWEAGVLWDSRHHVGVTRNAALDKWIGEPKALGTVRGPGDVVTRDGKGANMRLILGYKPVRILDGADLDKPPADPSGR